MSSGNSKSTAGPRPVVLYFAQYSADGRRLDESLLISYYSDASASDVFRGVVAAARSVGSLRGAYRVFYLLLLYPPPDYSNAFLEHTKAKNLLLPLIYPVSRYR
jgi:hypothetical protein